MQKLLVIVPYVAYFFSTTHSSRELWLIKHFYEDPCINWPESYFENNDQPNETLVNEVYEYGQRNLALIHLMIQSPYITKIKRDVAMTFTTYVANTGGLLGLCIGFSFISTIEILYWLCCCCRSFNHKSLYCNKEKWNSIAIKLTWKAYNFCYILSHEKMLTDKTSK